MITKNIYNDIKEYIQTEENMEEYYDVLLNVSARLNFGKNYSLLTSDELKEFNPTDKEINVISMNSTLFDMLLDWYGNLENLLKGMESAYILNDNIYFCRGWNYDIISLDVLGCDANGQARDLFIKFCNEDRKTISRGGFEYMKAHGELTSVYSLLSAKSA